MKPVEKQRVINQIHDLFGIEYLEDIKQGSSYVYKGLLPSPSSTKDSKQQVVVKMLGMELASNPLLKQRFDEEAKLYQDLLHENIVKAIRTDVVNFGDPVGTHRIIVMEYVFGRSLKAIISEHAFRRQRIDVAASISIICSVLDALQYLHTFKKDGETSPVIHADINPNNILVSESGSIKLIDFGLFRLARSESETSLKMGTFSHMAPEQFESRPLSVQTDLFSIAVVLGDLLVAGQINQGNNVEEIASNTNKKKYPLLDQPGIDDELKKIVLKGLEPKPDDRYQTAAEFKTILCAYAKKHKITVSSACLYDLMERLKSFTQDKTEYFDLSTNLPISQKLGTKRTRTKLEKNWPYLVGVALMLMILAFAVKDRKKQDPAQMSQPVVSNTQDQKQDSQQTNTLQAQAVNEPWHPDVAIASPGANIEIVSGEDKWRGQSNLKVGSDVQFKEGSRDFVGTISQNGYKPQQIKFSLTRDSPKYERTVQLEKLKTGTLFVGATPWAEITIPGVITNKVNPFTITIPEGVHVLSARYQDENKKWHKLSARVTIKPDGQHKCNVYFRGEERVECE